MSPETGHWIQVGAVSAAILVVGALLYGLRDEAAELGRELLGFFSAMRARLWRRGSKE